MKKKIFSLVAIAAISLGVWNYSENQNSVELSDFALANIEALANNESGSDKGTLYGNGSDKFCCKSGSNSCAAADC